jgi:hypothetical protein
VRADYADYFWKLYLDGRDFSKFRTNRFHRAPNSRTHELRARVSDRMILLLKPGDHMYIRTSLASTYRVRTIARSGVLP